MEGILKFNLPEEKESFDLAVNGYKWKFACSDIYQWLRSKRKYEELSDAEAVCFDMFWEKFFDILGEYELEIY